MAVQSIINGSHILSIGELPSTSSDAFPFSNTLCTPLSFALTSSHHLFMLLRDGDVEIAPEQVIHPANICEDKVSTPADS